MGSNLYEANTTMGPKKDFVLQPATSTSNNNFIILKILYNNNSFIQVSGLFNFYTLIEDNMYPA